MLEYLLSYSFRRLNIYQYLIYFSLDTCPTVPVTHGAVQHHLEPMETVNELSFFSYHLICCAGANTVFPFYTLRKCSFRGVRLENSVSQDHCLGHRKPRDADNDSARQIMFPLQILVSIHFDFVHLSVRKMHKCSILKVTQPTFYS